MTPKQDPYSVNCCTMNCSFTALLHCVLRNRCGLLYPSPHCLTVFVSGTGRNGTFTANLRFRFFFCKIYFRDYSRTTIENIRSKFAQEPTYFQEFLDPTKKKKSATSVNFIPAIALLRHLERTIHLVYEFRALATTATLKTRCHNALQPAFDF